MTPEENVLLTEMTAKVNALTESDLDGYANTLQWESYDVGPRFLSELDSSHLENILITQRQIALVTSTILHILKKRNVIGK